MDWFALKQLIDIYVCAVGYKTCKNNLRNMQSKQTPFSISVASYKTDSCVGGLAFLDTCMTSYGH